MHMTDGMSSTSKWRLRGFMERLGKAPAADHLWQLRFACPESCL